MARGRAASELAVAKASDAGSRTALKNLPTGTLMIHNTGINTRSTKAMRATYKVPKSFSRFHTTSKPIDPMVYAMAPPTANGAACMMMFTNLNITSVSDSIHNSMVSR